MAKRKYSLRFKKSYKKRFNRYKRSYKALPRSAASHNYMTKWIAQDLTTTINVAGNIVVSGSVFGFGIFPFLSGSSFWTNLIVPAGATGLSNTFNKVRLRKIKIEFYPCIQTAVQNTAVSIAGTTGFEIALIADRVLTSLGVPGDYDMRLMDNRKFFTNAITRMQSCTFDIPKGSVVTTTGYPALTQDWMDTKFINASASACGGLIVAAGAAGGFAPSVAPSTIGALKVYILCDFCDFE